MRNITLCIAAAAALMTIEANALDLGRLSERLLDCDGPGLALVENVSGRFGSPQAEGQGMAILELVELVIEDEDMTLRDAARSALGVVKQAAATKASTMIDKCGIGKEPKGTTIGNPFAPN